MNAKAKGLRMYKTRFANPHGLDHINNYSCCEDVYLMCKEAMTHGERQFRLKCRWAQKSGPTVSVQPLEMELDLGLEKSVITCSSFR